MEDAGGRRILIPDLFASRHKGASTPNPKPKPYNSLPAVCESQSPNTGAKLERSREKQVLVHDSLFDGVADAFRLL